MKHGILISAYTDFQHLIDLIECFDDDFYILIHIDKKAKVPRSILQKLESLPNVKWVSRKFTVNWGSLAHLQCILSLLKEAFRQEDITYFHLLSGQDFPIKSINEIKARFSTGSKSYLEWFEVESSEWKDEWHSRLSYFGLYDFMNVKYGAGRKINNGIVWLQKKSGLKRSLSSDLPKLFGGMTWWSLHRNCVEYVLQYAKLDQIFIKRLRFTFCPEELYFATIILNSKFRTEVINNDLRFIDWRYRNGNTPANLDFSDFTNLITSSDLFARRFVSPFSQTLKEKLQNEVLAARNKTVLPTR